MGLPIAGFVPPPIKGLESPIDDSPPIKGLELPPMLGLVLATFGTPDRDPSDSSFLRAALWLRVNLGFVPKVVMESVIFRTLFPSNDFFVSVYYIPKGLKIPWLPMPDCFELLTSEAFNKVLAPKWPDLSNACWLLFPWDGALFANRLAPGLTLLIDGSFELILLKL